MKDIPADLELPPALLKTTRRGPLRDQFEVSLKVVTPILGGGPNLRKVDEVDIIRTATIRGHLRFWWRALNAHSYVKPEDLYTEEARIWGRAGDSCGGRSPVELRVQVDHRTGIDNGNLQNEDTYALWPARSPRAERREPGLRFHLSVSAPKGDLDQVRNAVRLWILFGGYGSRTRRGLGALTVFADTDQWLPGASNKQVLGESLNGLFTAPNPLFTAHVPILAGASLLVKFPQQNQADVAWHTALHGLRDFRQGAPHARAATHGYSYWPEADSIRSRIKPPKGKTQHPIAPAHRAGGPRWPRAGFGLPISIRFNTDAYDGDPKPQVEIAWQANGETIRRLASPLIVKPLPVRGGFIPMALWLNRTDPANAKVFARQGGTILGKAPLNAPLDAPSFGPAQGKKLLREAFLDWLVKPNGWVKI